jgi:streptomycin 6-kinase
VNLPAQFQETIRSAFGDAGREWLARLPGLIQDCERRWSLQLGPAYELSYNYVAPATVDDGTRAVLKLGVPNPELTTEVAALRLYDGIGAVRLLEGDADAGILLMERLEPGTPLYELADDEAATAIAAETMGRLWHPLPETHPFPDLYRRSRSLREWRARYGGTTGPLPERYVDRAQGLYRELIASAGEPVLLHGDLHHWNILRARRAPWLAIDPKGVAGEPIYDTGAWLRNPTGDIGTRVDLRAITARRMAQFAEMLGFERERIAAWAFAQEVLSACWTVEEGGTLTGEWLVLADVFESLA